MTISTTDYLVSYTGDGTTTAFPVPYTFFGPTELVVVARAVDGTETTQALGTNYTLAGGNGAPGTVTATVAPASGVQWIIYRRTARTQLIDYVSNDAFPAETHERGLDRLTAIVQEIEGAGSNRALLFPITEPGPWELPSAASRAGNVLAFDNDGAPLMLTVTGTSIATDALVQAITNNALARLFPPGLILAWSGSIATIPAGWALCDGTNGTPNLRDRFIVGAGTTYSVNATGGAASGTTNTAGAHAHTGFTDNHILTLAQIPSHFHGTNNYVRNVGSGGAITGIGPFADGVSNTAAAGNSEAHRHGIQSDGAHTHTYDSLPPYFALAYIMRTGAGVATSVSVIEAAALPSFASERVFSFAASDEVTALTTGDAKIAVRVPYAMTLSSVRASLTTASTSGLVTINIRRNGTDIFSTALTIDANERTSVTAATPAVLSITTIPDDAEILVDIDGAGTGAAGLKIYMIGNAP